MNDSGRNVPPGGFLPAGLFSEDVVANPFPLFAQLREAGAVVAVPFGLEGQSVWMVTRLEEAVQVLKNQLFTIDPSAISFGHDQPSSPRGPGGLGGLLDQSMIAVDEPDHRRLRSLVSKAYAEVYSKLTSTYS